MVFTDSTESWSKDNILILFSMATATIIDCLHIIYTSEINVRINLCWQLKNHCKEKNAFYQAFYYFDLNSNGGDLWRLKEFFFMLKKRKLKRWWLIIKPITNNIHHSFKTIFEHQPIETNVTYIVSKYLKKSKFSNKQF